MIFAHLGKCVEAAVLFSFCPSIAVNVGLCSRHPLEPEMLLWRSVKQTLQNKITKDFSTSNKLLWWYFFIMGTQGNKILGRSNINTLVGLEFCCKNSPACLPTGSLVRTADSVVFGSPPRMELRTGVGGGLSHSGGWGPKNCCSWEVPKSDGMPTAGREPPGM